MLHGADIVKVNQFMFTQYVLAPSKTSLALIGYWNCIQATGPKHSATLAKDWECGAWQMTTCFMTVSTSMNIIIIIIPLEEAFPSYDSPAGDARVIQSGVKGGYLPWYVFNLPLQNRPHISSALLSPLSGELILIRLSDIISQMVWIL